MTVYAVIYVSVTSGYHVLPSTKCVECIVLTVTI